MNKFIKITFIVIGISIISLGCKNSQNNSQKTAVKKNTNSSKINENVNQKDEGKITVITPSEFKIKSKNQQILDVRTPSEFGQGYIKGAKNINIFDENFSEELNSFDKEKPIYVYCKSGHRSGIAVKKMAELGFKEIYDLKGGIVNWARSNQEIEK